MAEKKEFREKLSNDIKTIKKMIYGEEIISFTSALCFAANLACIVAFPLTGITIVNVFVIWWSAKRFKPTVKKQILYHEHLKFLNGLKEKKVWTQSDK